MGRTTTVLPRSARSLVQGSTSGDAGNPDAGILGLAAVVVEHSAQVLGGQECQYLHGHVVFEGAKSLGKTVSGADGTSPTGVLPALGDCSPDSLFGDVSET